MAEKSVSDEFEITIDHSFLYLVRKLATNTSPILTLIGLIKYRAFIYELFYKNYYQYRKYEEANAGD